MSDSREEEEEEDDNSKLVRDGGREMTPWGQPAPKRRKFFGGNGDGVSPFTIISVVSREVKQM